MVAADSALSLVKGDEGELYYCGYTIQDLAENISFEECIALLWDGDLPNRARLEELVRQLKADAHLTPLELNLISQFPKDCDPMAALRTGISILGMTDPEADLSNAEPECVEHNRRKAVRLVAKTPLIVGAFHRCRQGLKPLPWREDLTFAGNVHNQIVGEAPSPEALDLIDKDLILHADHGFNASTFAFRVTVATEADMYSGATTAVGTLKGRLHGGAAEAAMRTLLEIGEPSKVESHIRGMMDRKEKIMGMGHAVYKVKDPRAYILQKSSEALAKKISDDRWFTMSKMIEELVHAEKGLNANVDFYSASSYYSLGIPIDLFTPLFAISRMVGWTAHALEQYANNRLIRPKANYTGPIGKTFVPLDERG